MATMTSPPRALTGRTILQGIALVYAIAFISLGVQIEGLYGSHGILPAADYLQALASRFGETAWRTHPTLFWLGASDDLLAGACWAGAVSSLAMMAGYAPMLAAVTCWAIYFSLFQVGRVFLGFQWDILLLEAGFLAIFLAPFRWRSRRGDDPEPPVTVIWLYRWLLFRLMFASGVVKLLSGDAAWWHLTALHFHYWTQPLPTWTAWLVHQLPGFVHRFCVLVMFLVELGMPWFIFGPRPLRLVACTAFVVLQALIAATGNYTFFNLLTVVLCVSLLDDKVFEKAQSKMKRRRGLQIADWPAQKQVWTTAKGVRVALATLAALPLATAGGALMIARFAGFSVLPPPVAELVRWIEPLRVTGSYGLFSVMTRHRPEIILEGSDDGATWRPYELRWKPGNIEKMPAFCEPHQPRLDWQMWFAALGDWRAAPWLVEVERRLLEGSPAVLGLFANDPFNGSPPRQVRAMLYEYEFTDFRTFEVTGAWWRRRLVGEFSPPQTR